MGSHVDLLTNFNFYGTYFFENYKKQFGNDGKGQIKPKTDWRVVDSPKKTNERIWVFCSEEYKSKKKNKFVCSFFGKIYGAPI